MARIIINGDDFGMNESCSRAIAEAFAKGLITDTTAMANGEWIGEALKLAENNGFFDRLGVHLNLTEGKPLTERICRYPAFVTDGVFNKNAMKLSRALTDDENEAVCKELESQIMRLRHAGFAITHADSHHYIHNSPFLLPAVERVCRIYGIGKLRLQRDLSAAGVSAASGIREYNASLRALGFITTEHFGRPEDVAGRNIPDKTELLVHPDYDRSGVLIDRRGISNGCPVGEPLPDIGRRGDVELIDYSQL